MAGKLDPLLEQYLSRTRGFGSLNLVEVIIEYNIFPGDSDIVYLEEFGATVKGGSRILPILYAIIPENILGEIELNPRITRISLSGGVTPL